MKKYLDILLFMDIIRVYDNNLRIIIIMNLSELHLHFGTSQYKGKKYRSYSLAKPYRENGKNQKDIIVPLGKLTDEEANKWRYLLKALKKPDVFLTSFDDICVEKHFAYLDVAIANAVWERWGLDVVFQNDGKRLISIATIARILTINRCIDPAAKSKTPEWFKESALPWILGINPSEINPSRIFRELSVIESHKEEICRHLFKHFAQSDPSSIKSAFYDLSSTSFEGTKCKLMKWGHCKSGYENHVVLALVVNKQGLPFYWEVLPGCTADSKTITWLFGRLKKKFTISKTTFIFDQGMVSEDNLDLLETNDVEIKYISAMDRNQIETITDIDFNQFSQLDPKKIGKQINDALPDFTKMNENTFYREIKVEGKRRYILCFNPQLFKDQRKAKEQAIDNFREFAKNVNDELLEAKKSRQREPTQNKFDKRLKKVKLNKFIKVILSKKYVYQESKDESIKKILTYQGEVIVDDTEKLSAGKLDGFWLLVTNHSEKENNEFKLTAEEAINPYREKEIIEEAFRDIKSFIDIEPVYVWTMIHVKAHYSICVLSYLIDRTLIMCLHSNKGDISKEIVAHAKLFEEASKCKLDYIEVKNIQQKKFNLTKPTAKQKELLKRVGLFNLLDRKIIDRANKNLDYV